MADSERSTLFGRDVEAATLRAAADDAIAGRGSVWLLRGQPGIGKTRLATETREYAQRLGANTVHAFSWDQGGAPPFWPWRLAARTLGSQLADVVLTNIGIDSVEVLPHDDRDRFHLFADALRYLRQAADHAPIVVVLDDLHEADLATIMLLRFVAEGIADASILIIGTYRSDDLHQRPDLGEIAEEHLQQAGRAGGILQLEGLGPDHVRQLLQTQLGSPGALDDRFVTKVVALTQGNPLFVQHLAPTLMTDQQSEPVDSELDVDVPDGIRRVIHQRLEWLDPDARELLRTAAVVGPDVKIAVLSELSGRSSKGIVDRLGRTAERVFVSVDDSFVRFRHPLVREVLLAELDASDRSSLHERVADLLIGDDPDANVDEIAHHLTRSGPARSIDAARVSVTAARSAVGAFAFENAIAHLQRAIEMLDRTDDGDVELARFRVDVLMELGRIYWRAARRPECDDVFDEAWGLALALDDTDRLAEAALGGGMSKAFTTTLPNDRVRRCEVVLERLGPEPSRARCLALAKLASELVGDLDPTVSRRAAAESLEIARVVGEERAVGEALAAVLVNDLGPDRVDRRIELADEMLDIARRTNDLALAVQARFQLVGALVETGDRARLGEIVADQHRTVHSLAEPGFLRHDVWFRAMVAAVDGNIELAESLADEGLVASGIAHDPDGPIVWGGQLGVVRWMQGRINELEPLYRDMASSSPEPVWAAVLAWLWARNGMVAAADGQLERVRAAVLADAPRDRNWLLAAVTAGEATALAGPPDEVDGYIELLNPYADHLVPIAMGISFWGTVARPLAMLHLSRGDVADAVALHERAIVSTARFGALPWLVESQLDLADVLLRHVATPVAQERARELVGEADTAAQRLGLVESVERARALRSRLGAHADTTIADSAAGVVRPSVHVLGGFRCVDASGDEVRWTSRRARALLKTLVAARGQRVSRDVLISQLWPNDDAAGLSNRLSVALSTVRRSLDPMHRLERGDLVGADRDTVWLVTSEIDIDLEAFARDASSALRAYERLLGRDRSGAVVDHAASAEVIGELEFAIGRYAGPAFADEPYEDAWAPARDEARATCVALCRAHSDLASADGRFDTSAMALRALLAADPYDEPAHLALIELHVATGSLGLAELARARHETLMAELS